jgi:predicted phosphodiesterase
VTRARSRGAILLLLAAWLGGCQLVGVAGPPTGELLEVAESFLPGEGDAVRFAVIGDSGTGGAAQYAVAAELFEVRQRFPFEFVLMLGDNLYGRERKQDYERKFERPYGALLAAKVEFYAALGNHDDPNQRFYERFNMGGERYYSFRKGDVAFFALDSNYMDPDQLEWLERELSGSKARWKICFFHHPLYSSGIMHGSELDLRRQLEPLFLEHGVDVVFAGHEHFYERIRPQKGIYYFISGAAAKLRRGNIRQSALTERGFDTDHSFLLVAVEGDTLAFEALSGAGARIDAGVITQPATEVSQAPASAPGALGSPDPTSTAPSAVR